MTISTLPAPSDKKVPQQPSGTVSLYPDSNWSSKPYIIKTGDYAQKSRFDINGSVINDKATWIAFNLPVNTVLTLCEKTVSQTPIPFCNLAKSGRVIDLVGTGETVAIDLKKVNFNDCVSAFFWRAVDPAFGAIELFEDQNFESGRTESPLVL